MLVGEIMKRRGVLLGLIVVAIGSAAKLGGWNVKLNPRIEKKSLLIGGASAMFSLNEALKKEFLMATACCDMEVEKGGSLQGLIAVKRGAIDLAAMTRDLTDEEDDTEAHSYLVARGFITIIVNKKSAVKNLSQQQVHAIFSGAINNWKMLGGADAPINVISRIRGSSTRQFIEEVVIKGAEFSGGAKEFASTMLVAEAVSVDEYAIGYIASKDTAGIHEVDAVSVDGVSATPMTVLSNRYAYTQSFHLVIYGDQQSVAFDFINFTKSTAGQKIVESQGLVAVC